MLNEINRKKFRKKEGSALGYFKIKLIRKAPARLNVSKEISNILPAANSKPISWLGFI